MQVAQSEVVGIHHDDGIGIGDVDSVLHDGGGEQHVEVVVDESHDDLFQFLGLHLSMSDGYAAIGHLLLYQHLQFGELGYPVAHEDTPVPLRLISKLMASDMVSALKVTTSV